MRKLVAISLLAFLGLSCGSDPTVDKTRFPTEIATVVCRWYFACCDEPERKALNLKATSESDCISEVAAGYAKVYQTADPRLWNGKEGQACVDQMSAYSTAGSPTYCQRGFDPATTISNCRMIIGTTKAGDPCSSTWECMTKFCRMLGSSGICANPLPEGSPCAPEEPCQSGLRCINNKCQALKPDHSQCNFGNECISGACGNGECVVSQLYSCDGR